MKILHIGDIHLGLGHPGPSQDSRLYDTKKILNFVTERAEAENVDIVCVAGDCFKDAKVYLDRAKVEIQALTSWLYTLSGLGIQTVLISGTPSHDSMDAYDLIDMLCIPRVSIFTRPGIYAPKYVKDVQIACLPGLSRSQIVTKEEAHGLQPKEVHALMTEKLRDLCWGFKAQGADILLGHYTLAGAETGYDQLLLEHEAILTHEAVSPFSLVLLGHIHGAQIIPVSKTCTAYYCGSPERLSFSEEDATPGFWIHDTGTGESTFIETPARRYQTIDMVVEGEPSGLLVEIPEKYGDLLRDAMIRCRFRMTEEQAAAFDRRRLELELYRAGAYYVAEIRVDVATVDRARDDQVTEAIEPIEAVARWGVANEKTEDEIAVLRSATQELLEEVRS